MQYPIKTKQITINFEGNNKPAVFTYPMIACGCGNIFRNEQKESEMNNSF